jgi:hypothetical protein
MMRRIPLLLLLLALVACASPQPGTINQPTATTQRREFSLLEPFTLKIGTSLALKDAGLTISFVGVPSDERCGSCTASGNAEVVLQLTVAGQAAKQITLQVFPVARTYADALPYTVHMLDLQPTRRYPPDSIDASNYEVSLVVEKPTPERRSVLRPKRRERLDRDVARLIVGDARQWRRRQRNQEIVVEVTSL